MPHLLRSYPGWIRPPSWHFLALGALLLIHTASLLWGAMRQSPTLNEPAHLVAGLSHWQLGRFDLYRENPPLVRLVAAIPILLTDHQTRWSGFDNAPGSRAAFQMGESFANVNRAEFMSLLVLARWGCIPFSLIGAWTCYRWASDLAGEHTGLIAAVLWCGSPGIVGNAQLITADLAAATMAVLSSYLFWRWLQHRDWLNTLVFGVSLGLAALTKFTLLVLFPVFPLVWSANRLRQGREKWKSTCFEQLPMLSAGLVIAIYVINAGYGFTLTCQPLGTLRFVSSAFTGADDSVPGGLDASSNTPDGNRFIGTWLANLPLPVPADFVAGIDIQQADFEHFGRPSYLRGTFRDRGWWYYYLYGVAVKAPVPLLLMTLLAGIRRLQLRKESIATSAEALLIGVPALVFLIASAKCGFTHHMRYVLPCYPFVAIWAAVVLSKRPEAGGDAKPLQVGISRIDRPATYLLLIWLCVESTMAYPHSLSYFNSFVGGPLAGPRHLLGSNVDWGQDLLFLKDVIASIEDDEPFFLSYYGGTDPQIVGLTDWQPMPTRNSNGSPITTLPPGYYAVSANLLYGDPWPARGGIEPDGRLPESLRKDLLARERFASAGYSIYVYRVSP